MTEEKGKQGRFSIILICMYSFRLTNKETLETNGSEKKCQSEGMEETNVTKGDCGESGGGEDKALVRKKGFSTHVCLTHLKYLKYVLQYLFFLVCMESRRGLIPNCFVEDSATQTTQTCSLPPQQPTGNEPPLLARYAWLYDVYCVVLSGVFALLQAYAFLQYLKDRLTRQEFQTLFFLGVSLAAGIVFLTVIYLTYTGNLIHCTFFFSFFLLVTFSEHNNRSYLLVWAPFDFTCYLYMFYDIWSNYKNTIGATDANIQGLLLLLLRCFFSKQLSNASLRMSRWCHHRCLDIGALSGGDQPNYQCVLVCLYN